MNRAQGFSSVLVVLAVVLAAGLGVGGYWLLNQKGEVPKTAAPQTLTELNKELEQLIDVELSEDFAAVDQDLSSL